jgi:hypothetical protein
MSRNVAANGTAFRCDTLPRRTGVYARFGVRRGRASNAMMTGPQLTADRHALPPGGPQVVRLRAGAAGSHEQDTSR